MKKKLTQKDLIPPDLDRCQALTQNTFMTLGGRAGEISGRCKRAPVTIATEVAPDADGLRGSMSLCAECWRIFISYKGAYYASFEPIIKEK